MDKQIKKMQAFQSKRAVGTGGLENLDKQINSILGLEDPDKKKKKERKSRDREDTKKKKQVTF